MTPVFRIYMDADFHIYMERFVHIYMDVCTRCHLSVVLLSFKGSGGSNDNRAYAQIRPSRMPAHTICKPHPRVRADAGRFETDLGLLILYTPTVSVKSWEFEEGCHRTPDIY